MSAEDWQKCIDFFTSPTFVEQSSKNKTNRSKAKYLSVQELKSFTATHYDERDPETQQWSGIIDSFQTFHTFQDGNWVNPQAAGDYVASRGASLDECAIAKEVLEERRGHVRGVGRVPKGTSPSLDSTAASKTPQGTSHQFFGDPHNNDPRLAMYEAQLRRMQQEIEFLKNSIPMVVPEENENGDEE
ncbi:nuclear transcription factor Y subunit beta [Abeliophyllum distichum]|uniref:Nuclear transcription factor Y subunit beta n=1 Tax=Abeliophyllum distichum TaxID=126358 RepID=A0ABD1QV03_9LAMI